MAEAEPELVTAALGVGDIEVRDLEKREIGALIAPWGEIVDTPIGLESFERGSFAHIDPRKVVLRLEHQDPPAGRGLTIEERDRGAYMTFRVSKTPRGDEILTLAADGVTSHVSVGYAPAGSKFQTQVRANKRVTVLTKVDLREVSTTWKPYYQRAAVDYVRSQPEGDKPVDPTPEPTPVPIDVSPLTAAIAQLGETLQTRAQTDTDAIKAEFKSEIEGLKEQMRTQVSIPQPEPVALPAAHIWLQRAVFERTGTRVPEELKLATRALDDTTVAQNPGLFTNFLSDEVITNISRLRPFLGSTRRVDAPPPNTMSIQLPKVTQHTEFGVQATEKTAIATRDLRTTPVTYDMVSIFGGTDVSIQFILRGTPTAMRVLLDDMEAGYAQQSETEAIDALLDEADVVEGGTLDPQALELGAAFTNSYADLGQGPDTIWLSTVALSSFINAKASTTNQPLYGSISADINAAGGISGTLYGLRVVHVPALTAVGALIGPSRGYSWAEQAPIRLEVDNPELAGRDIALGGFMWFMPRHPAAFTSYNVIGS